MKPNDEEIQTLANQLNEWNIQMDFLIEKQIAIVTTAKRIAQELDELRAKHRLATQQLRSYETHRTGHYMWENIGDGG